MKRLVLISGLLLLLSQCNTRLNEEQRKQMAEARKKMEIRQVPEADLLKAGMDMGIKITRMLHDTLSAQQLADLSAKYEVTIRWFTPASPPAEPLLVDLMHAYKYAAQHNEKLSPHIQRIGVDTVLYAQPVVAGNKEKPVLAGMWGVFIPTKKLVLGMPVN